MLGNVKRPRITKAQARMKKKTEYYSHRNPAVLRITDQKGVNLTPLFRILLCTAKIMGIENMNIGLDH